QRAMINLDIEGGTYEHNPLLGRWTCDSGARVDVHSERADPEFKIGFVLSQIGSLAELSKVLLYGAEVGIAMVNDAGGMGGLKARLVVCDSQGKEPQAVICAKKLINDDQVKGARDIELGFVNVPSRASSTRSGVIGRRRGRAPVALQIALAIAGAA